MTVPPSESIPPSPIAPPPTPVLAENKPRRRPFALLWPLLVLGLLLLYNLAFTRNFFDVKVRYSRVDIQLRADTEVRRLARPTMNPFATLHAGDQATLARSDTNVDRTKMIEVKFGNQDGYIPADAQFSLLPKQPYFYGSLIDILKNGARVMLLALGMTLVIATGGIDLSVGAVMAIAGAIAACLLAPANSVFDSWLRNPGGGEGSYIIPSMLLLVGLPLLAGLLAGAWNGLLVSVFDIQPIIATLIFMISGRGIALLVTGETKPTYSPYPPFDFLGQGALLLIPFPVYIVAGFALLTILLTRRTALGLFIESIGNNPAAARVVGIHARFVNFMVYTFAGLCAGMAGLIQISDIRGAAPLDDGLNMELDAIVAVAIGGTSLIGGRFSIVGSLLGALIMQTLRTTIYSTPWLPSEFTLVVQALVVLIICLLQSDSFRSIVLRSGRKVRGEDRGKLAPAGGGAS